MGSARKPSGARKAGPAARGATSAKARVAIVAGLRTPFAKQATTYTNLSALDLGKAVVAELVQRSELDPRELDLLVFGQVVPSVAAPNIAREIVLGAGLPRTIDAFSVSRACATSFQAIACVAQSIESGHVTCGIAGGSDSTSDVPVVVSRHLTEALMRASKARTLGERLSAFKGLRPRDLLPIPPSPKELSTGLTMGEHAELMAKEHGVTRDAQDELAHRSHQRAAAAWKEGKLDAEVMHLLVPPTYETVATTDNTVRTDSDPASYAKLRPVFDARHGTVTAGTSSPLTDGAAAVLLMREDKADFLGYTPLGYVRSYAFAALDPEGPNLLLGPAYATPIALDRAGLTLADVDLVDMHEAFAAQVLANLRAFESESFALERLGRSSPTGAVDWDRFNVNGGSIAFGHPFAATGARMVTQTLRELGRRGGGLGLCTACAAGGLGAAMVLEVA